MKALAITSSIGVIVVGMISVLTTGQFAQGVDQILSGTQKTTVTNDNIETIQKKIEEKCEIETRSAGEGPYNTPNLPIDRIEEVELKQVTEDGSFSHTNVTYNLLSSQQVEKTNCKVEAPEQGSEITLTRNQDHRMEVSCSDCAAEPPVLEISKKGNGGD